MKEYIERLRDGSLKMHAIESEVEDTDRAIAIRRAFIEEETGNSFKTAGNYSMSTERAAKKNCENMIGAVQIPLGVAG
ncbi:MAG: 3-hydroxy-3-methylglutaryl-CoA reductase, partial [Methanomicrobium sp.]|nr:3-hydroxy-3-methylglutaryl-CoA reductase [Methanomicrobium sp.]